MSCVAALRAGLATVQLNPHHTKISRVFHNLVKFAVEDIVKTPGSRPRRSQSNPTRSSSVPSPGTHSSVLACICSAQAWHLNLIGFSCAWAFPTLLRLPRASASFATGRGTPPPNRSCIPCYCVITMPFRRRGLQRQSAQTLMRLLRGCGILWLLWSSLTSTSLCRSGGKVWRACLAKGTSRGRHMLFCSNSSFAMKLMPALGLTAACRRQSTGPEHVPARQKRDHCCQGGVGHD